MSFFKLPPVIFRHLRAKMIYVGPVYLVQTLQSFEATEKAK